MVVYIFQDLKPANLLIGYDGVLRIADLGQARLAKGRPFSHQVGSRWYRSPELLYGSRKYSFPVDLWSVGCIIAEMVNGSPLFPVSFSGLLFHKFQSNSSDFFYFIFLNHCRVNQISNN